MMNVINKCINLAPLQYLYKMNKLVDFKNWPSAHEEVQLIPL